MFLSVLGIIHNGSLLQRLNTLALYGHSCKDLRHKLGKGLFIDRKYLPFIFWYTRASEYYDNYRIEIAAQLWFIGLQKKIYSLKNQCWCMYYIISCSCICLTHLLPNHMLNGEEAEALTGYQVVSSGDRRKWIGTPVFNDMPRSNFLPLKKLKLRGKMYSFCPDRKLTEINKSFRNKEKNCSVFPFQNCYAVRSFRGVLTWLEKNILSKWFPKVDI